MVTLSIIDRLSFVLPKDKIEFSIIFTNDDKVIFRKTKSNIIINPQCTAAFIPIDRILREIKLFNTITVLNNSNLNNDSVYEYFVGKINRLSHCITDIYFCF